MEEIWKDIKGYEGLYQISNSGKVKSFRRSSKYGSPDEMILKPQLINSGYEVVTLYSHTRRSKFQIHRLVAETFIPNPYNFPCVNHKDENKLNNCVDNLEWCTYQYNNNYGTAKIRSVEKRARPIRQMTLDGYEVATYRSTKIACDLLGFAYGAMKYWLEVGSGNGYKWEYIK